MTRWIILIVVTMSGLIADQATKLIVDGRMVIYQSIPLIDGLFNLTYLRNKGAAFSFLSNTSWRLPFFISVSVVAAIVIVVAMKRLREEQKLAQLALSMIFSGALGNLVDRVRMGEVIDFLDFYIGSHHWPAFNVADSLITVGVFLVAIDMLREERRLKSTSVSD